MRLVVLYYCISYTNDIKYICELDGTRWGQMEMARYQIHSAYAYIDTGKHFNFKCQVVRSPPSQEPRLRLNLHPQPSANQVMVDVHGCSGSGPGAVSSVHV